MLKLRYTDKLQKALKCNVKSEPWLHCVIVDKTAAIYVWDSRQVVAVIDAPGEDAFAGFVKAVDNGMPLQGLGKNQWINTACHFTDVTTVDQIKAILTQKDWTKRRIACLKAIYRIWEIQSQAERNGERHTAIDGVGFGYKHLKPMGRIASCLARRRYAMIGEDNVRYACNVAPMYAKQLAWLANGGYRSPEADRIEQELKRILT